MKFGEAYNKRRALVQRLEDRADSDPDIKEVLPWLAQFETLSNLLALEMEGGCPVHVTEVWEAYAAGIDKACEIVEQHYIKAAEGEYD